MPLTARPGFSLVEVVIAAALLAATVAVVSAAVGNGASAGARVARLDRARSAVEEEIERLRSVPFCAEGAAGGSADKTLLDRVFPHAVPARNTPAAAYQVAGTGAGAFVTRRSIQGGVLQVTARFVVSSSSGWTAVPSATVEGYAADVDPFPPSSSLALALAYFSHADDEASAYTVSTVVCAWP